MQYPATELVLNNEGKVYHLNLFSHQVSENIILVGDQDRVDLVASFFDSIEHASQNREFVCKTGTNLDAQNTSVEAHVLHLSLS